MLLKPTINIENILSKDDSMKIYLNILRFSDFKPWDCFRPLWTDTEIGFIKGAMIDPCSVGALFLQHVS